MTEEKNQESAENTQVQEGQIVNQEYAQGFSLTGEFVKNLKDKRFAILDQRTQIVKDLDNAGKFKEKCILKIRLADGQEVDYFPNKTSMQVIINHRGFRYKDWIGFSGELMTAQQKVGKDMKEVIYIKE
jgi:hypothetical protein